MSSFLLKSRSSKSSRKTFAKHWMFLHPVRVRPLGKPLELYFHRMLPSKGSALVRCRCVFVFTTLDNLFASAFFICVFALCCAPVTHRYFSPLCVYLVSYLFLSHFHALFTSLCYQWVLQSLKVWFWNLSSLLRLIPRRRRKKTSYNNGRAQPLLEIKCIPAKIVSYIPLSQFCLTQLSCCNLKNFLEFCYNIPFRTL